MDIQGDMGLLGDPFDPSLAGRDKDDGFESRSGSDNLEGVSGDEQEAGDDQRRRKKKYHRHTQHQIQELEAFFKECLHPDEKQRSELSRRLCLENKQIKFWFQNRRTQMKEQEGVDAVFVNAILNGIQQRNLERAWSKPVLDRVGLIIEIFNAHAHTKEAKVQAELAALMYKKSRLVRVRGPKGCNTFGATGLGEAEVVSARGRASGGRGFISGAGETELQLQRRRLCRLFATLDPRLKSVILPSGSSFCSKVCCMVANPISGSRRPTRQLLTSTPFFCLGFIFVGLAISNRSFKAPSNTEKTINPVNR